MVARMTTRCLPDELLGLHRLHICGGMLERFQYMAAARPKRDASSIAVVATRTRRRPRGILFC